VWLVVFAGLRTTNRTQLAPAVVTGLAVFLTTVVGAAAVAPSLARVVAALLGLVASAPVELSGAVLTGPAGFVHVASACVGLEGMVVAFARIESIDGAPKPSDLAGGIWEALLTTVFGLVVAIPCMAAYHAFESHADKIARRMELAVTALDDALQPGCGRECPVAGFQIGPLQTLKDDYPTVA
jgi:hypothetical protein